MIRIKIFWVQWRLDEAARSFSNLQFSLLHTNAAIYNNVLRNSMTFHALK